MNGQIIKVISNDYTVKLENNKIKKLSQANIYFLDEKPPFYYNDLVEKCPNFISLFSAIKDLNQVKYTIVILEQLLFLVIAVIMAVYSDPMPMCALFWGFAIHTVLQHFFLSVLFRSYYPGLISSVLLLPYFAYGIYSLLNMYSIVECTYSLYC